MRVLVGVLVLGVLLLCTPVFKQQYAELTKINAQDKRLCAEYRTAREGKQWVKAYALARQVYDLPEPRSCAPHWATVQQNAIAESKSKGLSLEAALRQASQKLE